MDNYTRTTIMGAGQQGGSIATGLGSPILQPRYDVSVYDVNAQNLGLLQAKAGAKITTTKRLALACNPADIIGLATPMSHYTQLTRDIAQYAEPGTIVFDVGSVKMPAMQRIQDALPANMFYIGTHPIMGKTGFGPLTSDPDMYRGKTVIVIPTDNPAAAHAQARVTNLWEDLGANVKLMDALSHDVLYGTISHFQHAAAFALSAMGEQYADDYRKSGDTLLNLTRITGGKPEDAANMWLPIFSDNREVLVESAYAFRSNVATLKQALLQDDTRTLENLLTTSHRFRADIPEARKRETLRGEIEDLVGQFETSSALLFERFNIKAQRAFAIRTLFPAFLSAAFTLNAIDTEHGLVERDILVSEFSNPSFNDGTAAMLNDPLMFARFLMGAKDDILKQLDVYMEQLDKLMGAIDARDQSAIRAFIEKSASFRNTMPAHRISDQMRDDYLYEPLSHLEHMVG